MPCRVAFPERGCRSREERGGAGEGEGGREGCGEEVSMISQVTVRIPCWRHARTVHTRSSLISPLKHEERGSPLTSQCSSTTLSPALPLERQSRAVVGRRRRCLAGWRVHLQRWRWRWRWMGLDGQDEQRKVCSCSCSRSRSCYPTQPRLSS